MELLTTLERIQGLLACAHDLVRWPTSARRVAELVEEAYLLTAEARARAIILARTKP